MQSHCIILKIKPLTSMLATAYHAKLIQAINKKYTDEYLIY